MSHKENCSDLEENLTGGAGIDTAEAQCIKGGAIDPQFEKTTIRKVDRRLLIILGALYSISLVDKSNLGLARVAGMAGDLQLTVGERFSIITLVFFVPYILFELPFNILLRKVGVRNFLASITVLWGGVTLGMGFVETWQQLAVLRALLGLTESGFFPGCFLLIQTWYTRFETQRRIAVFYLVGMVVVGFSQIFSYGVSTLDGAHGLAGWRWIFIIMGAITIGFGLISFFLIVDFPDKNTFLTAQETALVIERVNRDRGDAVPDSISGASMLKHCFDPRIWAYGLLFGASSLSGTAFAYFLPVILSAAGYSTVLSLCMSAPPWIFAAIYTYVIAFAADKTKRRGIFICVNALLGIVGLFIVGYAENRGLATLGVLQLSQEHNRLHAANVPAVLAYSANNMTSHSKRAFSSAVIIGVGGVGSVIASAIYRQQDYPRYLPGLRVTIGAQIMVLATVGVLTYHFATENKKADQGRRGPIEGQEGFRYTI